MTRWREEGRYDARLVGEVDASMPVGGAYCKDAGEAVLRRYAGSFEFLAILRCSRIRSSTSPILSVSRFSLFARS
jgi:hypothetical protein